MSFFDLEVVEEENSIGEVLVRHQICHEVLCKCCDENERGNN